MCNDWNYQRYEVPVIDISYEICNKAGVAVIKVRKNDNVNKIAQKLPCIFDVIKECGFKNLYDLVDKEIQEKYWVRKNE